MEMEKTWELRITKAKEVPLAVLVAAIPHWYISHQTAMAVTPDNCSLLDWHCSCKW